MHVPGKVGHFYFNDNEIKRTKEALWRVLGRQYKYEKNTMTNSSDAISNRLSVFFSGQRHSGLAGKNTTDAEEIAAAREPELHMQP